MSSFKRSSKAGVASVRVHGTKPWINGQHLVSTGHKELDVLLGGGHALGTSLVMELDDFSNYGETLFSYGIAESLSAGFVTVLVTSDVGEAKKIMGNLPYNLTLQDEVASNQPYAGILTQAQALTQSQGQGQVSATTYTDSDIDAACPEGGGGGEVDEFANTVAAVDQATDTEGKGLSVAWQYAKYLKANSAVTKKEDSYQARYCCSFDLGRQLQHSIVAARRPVIVSVEDSCGVNADLNTALNGIVAAVRSLLHSHVEASSAPPHTASKRAPVRIFVPALARLPLLYDLETPEAGKLMYHFLLQLKLVALRANDGVSPDACPLLPSLAISVAPNITPTRLCERLLALADSAVSIEGFLGRAAPPPQEFRLFVGLLSVRKLQSHGTMAPFRPAFSKFGLKRDRRKLKVEPLHLPPEDSRAFVSDEQIAKATSMGMKPLGQQQQQQQQTLPVLPPKPRPIQPGGRITLEISPSEEPTAGGGVSISTSSARSSVKRFTLRRDSSGNPVSNVGVSNVGAATAAAAESAPGQLCSQKPSEQWKYEF
jgi:elongator complex protein 4